MTPRLQALARHPAALFVLTGAAFFASVRVGLTVTFIAKQVSPVWIATGIGLVAMLKLGPKYAPAIVLGALAANLESGTPFAPSLFIALGNATEALLGAWLLRRAGFDSRLERVKDVLALLVASAVISTAAGAAIGVTALWAAEIIPADKYLSAWLVWQVGDGIGALIIAPPLLSLLSGGRPPVARGRWLEALAVSLFVLGVALYVFRTDSVQMISAQPFLVFPPVLWTALRFGVPGATFATLAVSIVATIATATGNGPYAQPVAVEGVLVLQLFMAVVALSAMLLAAAFAERRNANAQATALAEAIRSIEDGILIADADGRILFANEGMTRLFGYRPAELIGQDPRLFNHPRSDPRSIQAVIDAMAAGRQHTEEAVMRRKDGSAVLIELRLWPVRDEDGRVVQFVATHHDITARKELQGRLMAAERMATVGTLAAGVAHEINNPLSYFTANVQFAQREVLRFPQTEVDRIVRVVSALQNAAEGADRVAAIVKDLKVFSRQRDDEKRVLALDQVVERALAMAANEIRHRARLVKQLDGAARVVGNEGRLVQVILNLLLNAAQSIPESDPSRHEISVLTREDGELAILEVGDTGVGIPPEIIGRIFEPFFTTKAGQGTGLGLSICHQIVTDHGGQISIDSTPARGTRVTVKFKRAALGANDPAANPEPSEPSSAIARRRILVIDDEPRIVEGMQRLLQPEHEVVGFTSGDDALRRLSSGERFDVIFCDLQMPGASGMEVYARLLERAPDQAERMVFVSGGAFTPAAQAFAAEMGDRVLDKPVKTEVIHATIAKMLARQ